MANLARRIQELRAAAGMSQEEFARAVGVSRSAVSMYERAEREPSLATLEAIAARFGVDMNYLLSDAPGGRQYSGGMSASDIGAGLKNPAHEESSDYSASALRERYGLPYGTPLEDILEAMHKNPKLGILFSRSARMDDSDVDFMLQMAERIRGGE
jgi:transcriptional regulator with XRE-family HTH domain